MAETIRGINIQIGAETTALSKALGDVNKRSRDIQSELKQVEKLLKLDPGNTELIAQKQKLLSDSIENTSQKLDVMRKAQQQVNDQFERGEINDGQYRAFQRELIKTENELDNLRSGLNTVSPEFKKLSELSEETAKKMADVGSKLSDVGKKLSVGLSAPIVGLGAIAGKAALDVDAAAGKMEASLGVTAEQAEELAEASRGIWKKGFGESLDQVNRALVTTRTNVQGLNNEQLTKLTQQALVLQQTFDADINETTRTASVLMKNFGVDGNKAMDLITVGFQNGGDFSGELLDTLREYAPQFKALGISAEDAMGMLLEGTENGAFNLDKIGDALKEFNIRLKDGSDSTYEAMAQLFAPDDVEAFSQALVKGSTTSAEYLELLKHVSADTAKTLVSDLRSGGKKAEDAFIALNSILGDSNAIFEGLADGSVTGQDALVAVIQKLREIEDPLYQNQLAVSLFGTQWEDLEKDVILALDAGIGKLQDIEGATDKAGEAVTDNLGTRFQSVLRELQSSLAPLGKALLDIAERVMPIIQSAISKFSKALSNMSPSTQTLVLGLGAIAAAVGPLLVVFGSLMGALGPLLASLPTLGLIFGAMTGPIGLVVAGIAGLVAGGIALYKHLSKESIPEIQRFGDEVSESTQKAVGGFLDLNDQATLALNQLQWSGQTITSETAQSIISTFSQMGDQVLAAMKEDHAAQIQEMNNFYASSSVLTEQEEQAAIAKMKEYQTSQSTVIQEGQARIKEIMETAQTEKRAITDAERNEINNIQKEMVQTGIKHMSENELEQKAILERMRQNASSLSARQAAEVVKNSVKQRDETIAAADKQYNDVVKSIIQQRDEVGSITAEQATKLIAEAKKQRDESVKHAQSMHNDVLKEAKAQAGSHVNQVNWETGEILKKWDIFVADVKKKWEQMKQWASNIFGDMWKSITTKTDEIKTDVTEKWNNVIDFFKNIDLKQIGADIMNGLKNGIKSKAEELYQEAKDIASNVGEAIRNFFGIKSPSRLMMGYGEYISEGLAIGIADAGRLAVKSAENLSGAVSKAMSVDPVGLSVAASNAMSGAQGSTPTGGVVNQYNMEGMFKGANFNVRNDEDIRKLSQGIGSYITGNSRGLGGVAT